MKDGASYIVGVFCRTAEKSIATYILEESQILRVAFLTFRHSSTKLKFLPIPPIILLSISIFNYMESTGMKIIPGSEISSRLELAEVKFSRR